MHLKSINIENFRGYKNKTSMDFNDLTAIVGKNDIGKSTILEALDIFFNDGKGLIRIDKDDVNIECQNNGNFDISISLIFDELPGTIVIDTANETTLKKEYLLNDTEDLEIVKIFNRSTVKTYVKAIHPKNDKCSELLTKKNGDLKKIVEELGLSCDKTKNAEMRAAIWNHYNDNDDLQLNVSDLDVGSKDGDMKSIWTKLKTFLPYYSLFQSDRKNSDGDDEVQDPLKEAVKQIMLEEGIKSKLNEVANSVKTKLQEVSNSTLRKLQELNPQIADSLHPNIPDTESLKWSDVFKGLSIYGDGGIPINKRGSGVRRLVLISFFRAEAEKRMTEENNPSIIYAIEEPETSQHKEHQRLLITALKSIAKRPNAQIIITTHSSDIVKQLTFEDIRLLLKENDGVTVKRVQQGCLPYPSLNEVNYKAFNDISEEYHNELYGYLQSCAVEENSNNEKQKDFDNWLVGKNNAISKNKRWSRVRGNICDCTGQTYIRNFIHHPENSNNILYSIDELKISIEKMVKIAMDMQV